METNEWKSSKYSNLRVHSTSGVYHIHAHVHGRLLRKSLKTTSATIAQAKRDAILDAERAKVPHDGPMETFGHALKAWLAAVAVDKNLKPRSRDYKQECSELVERTWPGLADTALDCITRDDCLAWAGRLSAAVGATRFNGSLQTFRAVMKAAGFRNDPAADVKQMRVRSRKPTLPDAETFSRMLVFLKAHPARKEAHDLVRLLAYSGMRISEAREVRVEHVDLNGGKLTIFGDPEHGTKTAPFRAVPLNSNLKQVLTEMIDGRKEGMLTPITVCRKALNAACHHVEIANLTHHDMRDYFATRCIESGVDIPTVAKWLGHKDGGALLMKTYAHLRDDHSKEMAKKVSF